MAKKNLGSVELVDTIKSTDNILAEVGGSVRLVPLSDVIEAENEGSVRALAMALADLIPQSGLGNAYIRLVNSEEGESVVTIDGESVTIGAGAVYSGYVDDWSGVSTNSLKSVVVIGNVSVRMGSASVDNYTLESMEFYYAQDYSHSMQNFCRGLRVLTNFVACGGIATSCRDIVSYCDVLQQYTLDIETSTAKDFYGFARYSPSIIKEDISCFDTSSATDMCAMFQGHALVTSLDVSHFNTSKVTLLSWLFVGMSSIEVLDVSSFDISNVTNVQQLFRNCSALRELKFGVWDMEKVTTTTNFWGGCSALTTITGEWRNVKVSLSASACPLTRESALVIINGLSEDHEDGATLTLSSTTKGYLTDDDIAIATNKGWTIA